MEAKKSFLSDENATGFSCLIICGEDRKTSIDFKCRIKPGEKLEEISIENASDAQLYAVCDALENI